MLLAKLPVLSLATVLLAAAAHASIEVRAKADQTQVYRTEALQPPPLASLFMGQPVTLLHRGADRSQVQTEEGVIGWVRNADLQAIRPADGQAFNMDEIGIQCDEVVYSPFVIVIPPEKIELADIHRSFKGEIVEPMDREQTEMRHDEN